MLHRLLPLLLLTTIPTVLPAQRIVVVDTANGPGTNHTTLASAFANLLANDVLVVRAGTYDGAYLSTPLSFVMQGEGNPLVVPAPGQNWGMNLVMWGGQQQRIAIKGMQFRSQSTGQWALQLGTFQNSWPAPTVHLENCSVFSISLYQSRVGLLAQSIGLTVQGCTLDTTQVSDCVATIVGSTITGHDLAVVGGSTQDAEPALDLLRSEVWIVDSTLRAGNSNGTYGAPASCVDFSDYSNTTASKVKVCGNSLLQCDQSPSASWPAPHVFHNYAPWYVPAPTVDHEPSVTLIAMPGGQVFGTGVTPTQRSVACATGSTAPLGGTFTTTVQGNPNDIALVEVSLTTFAQRLLGVPVFLNLGAVVPLPFAVLGASGTAGFGVAIPNQANLRGTVIEASAATLNAAGALEITNPVAGIVQ